MASDVANDLFEQEQRLWHEIKGMHATLVTEKREFNVDEKTKFDNLHGEVDRIDTRLRDLLKDEKRARDTDAAFNEFANKSRSGPVAGESRAAAQFNEEIRSMANGDRNKPVDCGYDQTTFSKSRMGRALGINTNSGRPMSPQEARVLYDNYVAGGNPGSLSNPAGAGIVPIDFYDTLISYLIEVSGLMQVGPNVLNTTGGEPIQMPYVTYQTGQTSAGTPVNISAAQAATLATADPGFGQKLLTSNKFGQLIQIPRELLDDAGVNLLDYLAMSAGRNLGNAVGSAMIGNGASQMSGTILGAPVAVTGAVSGAVSASYGQVVEGAPRYSDLVNLQYSVIAPYRQSKSCYWLAADQSLGTLRQMVDQVGRPIWEPSTILGAPDLLLGKPIVADPFMPQFAASAKSIAFGDFSQFVVRLIGGVRFERSDDFAFGSDVVSFRAVLRADSNLLNPPTGLTRSQPVVVFQGNAA